MCVLVGWSPEGGAWVLGEWCGDGRTPLLEQAAGIRSLVRRRGLHLRDVRHLVGDINSAGPHGQIGSMNEALTLALAKVIAKNRDPAPPAGWGLRPANKRKGSVDYRLRMLNGALSDRRLWVHESCNRLINSMRQFKPGSREAKVLKDPLDALGYIVEQWLRAATPQPSQVEVRR